MPTVPDQTDLVQANEKLTADLTQVNADLSAVKASLASVTTERDTAQANLAEVTKERDALKASQADFDRSVAAKVAEMGISANAVPKNKPDAKPSAAVIPLTAFNSMSHAERNEFIRNGGKISD